MERGGVLAAVLCACIVSLAGAVSVDGHVAVQAKISPTLNPPSSKHFYKSDYPKDLSPSKDTHEDFDPPFPAVQDSDEYDKDFVKDENSDDGEWKYQSDYDRLRGKLAQARADKEKALKLEAKKEKELADAKSREAMAKARAKSAYEEKMSKERAAQGKYEKEERDLNGLAPPPQGKDVKGATKEVDGEVKDLEDCQRQLKAARAQLKELQEERKKAEAREKDLEAAADAAEEAQVAKMKAEEVMEGKVQEEQSDYNKAHQVYLKESKSLAKMEDELKKAEAKLRRFRHSEGKNGGVDPDGGVFRTPVKSGAMKTMTPLSVLSAIAVLTVGGALV